MKRALLILMFAVVGLSLAMALAVAGTNAAWKRAGRQPWPAELGTLEEMEARFPKRRPSADALRLAELARPLGIVFSDKKASAPAIDAELTKFVDGEGARGVVAIEAPPASVAEFVAQHSGQLDALRDHLNGSRDIAWEVDLDQGLTAPIPNLIASMRTMRVLTARALIRARDGDPGAWDDLRAVSMLDRSLQSRAELIPQVIALAIGRRVNAAAWKLPVPAPAWLADYQAIDRRRLFLQGVQSDAWAMWRHAPMEYSDAFQRMYLRASVTNLALHERETAIEMARVTECGFDAQQYSERRGEDIPKWNTVGRVAIPNYPWSRMLRYEAEREATANALRVRAGVPIVASSRCSDGGWRYEAGRLAFARDIPEKANAAMPLLLQVVADHTPAREDQLHVERR